MGVADVRVLNGGVKRWRQLGYPLETKRNEPEPNADFGRAIPVDSELIVTTEAVPERLASDDGFTLVDTRTWDEFVGKKSGYSYHKFKGRIPGAIYGQSDFRGKDSMAAYRNIDGTMRNAKEILRLWKDSKIDTKKHLCFYCGGGWRAAEVLMYARVMGLENSSLYSDGWIGWSQDPENPRELGDGR